MSRDRHSANSPTMSYNIAAMLANRSTSKTEPSTPIPLFMEGSLSRCEPSTLKTHIVDGSIEYSRTFHANPPFHGRFSFQVRTFRAEDPYRGRFNRKQPNLPRQYPLFMEGSVSRCEPSTPKTHIVDGSIEYSRTFHAEDPYHGRFMPQKRTFHAEDLYRGRFMLQKRTLHARGRYHGRFASLKSAYYTWQRK